MSKDTNAPWRDEELLREKYIDERKSPDEMTDDFNCSRTTLYKWLNEYGLVEELDELKDRPWRDADRLRELYVEKEMSVFEAADELGCSGSAVQRNLKKHGIETREVGGFAADAPHKQKEKLRELYVEQGLSSWELADELGVSQKTVLDQLRKNDIEVRKSNRETPPTYYTRQNGYEYVMSAGEAVFVHQLVAIANGADPYKVLGDLTHVTHHKIPIPWLNTPDNIELVTQSEHRQHHGNQYTD